MKPLLTLTWRYVYSSRSFGWRIAFPEPGVALVPNRYVQLIVDVDLDHVGTDRSVHDGMNDPDPGAVRSLTLTSLVTSTLPA